MLKLPVKPPIVNENIDLSEYAKKSDVDAIGTSLGNKAEKKEVEKINSQLDTLTKKVDDEIKEIQSTTDTFKENINTSFNEFSNEQQNNFEALREEVLSDIEASYVGYDNEQHHSLESRLYSDFDKINQRFNDSSYLEYEGTSIKADNTYYGLTKDTVIKGRTLQNIVKSYKPSEFQMLHAEMVSEGVFKLPEGESVNHTNVQARARNHMYKPNTTYTVFVDILENITSKKLGISNINSMISPGYGRDFQNLIGVSCVKFTTSANGLSPQGTPPALGIYFGIWNANDTSGEFSKYIKFKYWILEGDHTNTPIEELPFIEGIKGTGDTSKNLFNGVFKSGAYLNSTGVYDSGIGDYICSVDPIEVKPNTTYQCVNNQNSLGTQILEFDDNGEFIRGIGTVKSFRTSSNVHHIQFNVCQVGIKAEETTVQIEEGSTATSYEPYFSGYKVSGKSCGKNLFDNKKLVQGTWEASGSTRIVAFLKRVKKGDSFIFESFTDKFDLSIGFTKYNVNDKNNIKINESGWIICNVGTTRTISANADGYLFVQIRNKENTDIEPSELTGKEFLVKEGETLTPFEEYKESNYSYILNEPLMQLPNGVADSIDLETGILTRRVGKFVFEGNENCDVWTSQCVNDTTAFYLTHHLHKRGSKIICNKLPVVSNIAENNDFECIDTSDIYIVRFRILNSNLESQNAEGVRKLFAKWYEEGNPLTVYYELAEPTTEQLTPTQLKSFEGTTHIMSNNTLQAHTSVKIHSYVQAVVTNLINENEALRSNVDILNVENEELKETNEVQDELIDINMMATDEVYTMIEPLLASQPMSMERGVSKLVDMYVAMVQRGLKTIDQVPICYRAEVQAILEALEK